MGRRGAGAHVVVASVNGDDKQLEGYVKVGQGTRDATGGRRASLSVLGSYAEAILGPLRATARLPGV